MDSKLAATCEEFEPLCKWQREEGRDTLVLHLQGTIIYKQFVYFYLNLTHVLIIEVGTLGLNQEITITTKYTNYFVLNF